MSDFEYQLAMLIPELVKPHKRLQRTLSNMEELPRVSVFGKYNHGKSSLLNALAKEEVFSVADQRETREVSSFEVNGIQWVDAPGLGADLDETDDSKAHQAAFEQADILMLVHAVNTGELDREECCLFNQILKQDNSIGVKVVVVLTRVDQLSPEDLDISVNAIRAQLPDVKIFETSATRYNKGLKKGKQVLVQKSGIESLRKYLIALSSDVPAIRAKEAIGLIRKMRKTICDRREYEESEKESAEYKLADFERNLTRDIEGAF